MDSFTLPIVLVVVVGLVGLFVFFAKRTSRDEGEGRERLLALGLRVDDPKRLFGVGTRGGREVSVELVDLVHLRGNEGPRAAKIHARAVLPVPVLLLVSRNVLEREWEKLGFIHDPRSLHEVPTHDGPFDQAFRTFVRDPDRLPFVDRAETRAKVLDAWAGGHGLATLETGGADVHLMVESHREPRTALDRPLDLAVALASLRA